MIKHSSKRWSSCWINDTFALFSPDIPFSISIDKANDCQWIDKSRGSRMNWYILVNLPAASCVSDSVLTPRSNLSCERNSFSNKTFIFRASDFDDFADSFKASNKWRVNSPIISIGSDSVWWINGRSNNFDFDLTGFWFSNVDFTKDWNLFELFDNNSFLFFLSHFDIYIFLL